MFTEIKSFNEFTKLAGEYPALLAYFSTNTCNICKVLKPKVEEMVLASFPEMLLVYIDSGIYTEIAAQTNVFTIPTLIVYFDGKEFLRRTRAFGIEELKAEISRIYSRLFS